MDNVISRDYDDIQIGDISEVVKLIAEEDVQKFAEVSLDNNPLHLNEEYAKTTRFGKRIVHGVISASLISAIVGTKLPGIKSIYMGQNLKFLAPVYIGDTLTAKGEVIAKRDDKQIVTLKTTVTNQDGVVVTDGEATVMVM